MELSTKYLETLVDNRLARAVLDQREAIRVHQREIAALRGQIETVERRERDAALQVEKLKQEIARLQSRA